MQEKEKIDEQLLQLKQKYQQIDTDVSLDWQRLERYEELSKQKTFIVKVLKFAACFVLFMSFLGILTGVFMIIHFSDKLKPNVKTIAFSNTGIPQTVTPPAMPGPGGMSTVSSYINQQNISIRPDFNKMPTFSMPSMVSKKTKKDKGKD